MLCIAKTWKQPKCPLIGMDKGAVVHICNGILLSHKKNEIMSFVATWMKLEILMLCEVSQKEKDKYMISLICGM